MVVAHAQDLLGDAEHVVCGSPLRLREQEAAGAIGIVEHVAQRRCGLHAHPAAGSDLRRRAERVTHGRWMQSSLDARLDAEVGVEPTPDARDEGVGTDDVAALTSTRQDRAHAALQRRGEMPAREVQRVPRQADGRVAIDGERDVLLSLEALNEFPVHSGLTGGGGSRGGSGT
jgi:hypothetical protein